MDLFLHISKRQYVKFLPSIRQTIGILKILLIPGNASPKLNGGGAKLVIFLLSRSVVKQNYVLE